MGNSTSCCICMEKKSRGVNCTNGHFTCKECFPQYLNSTCENGGRLCDHAFQIRCPDPICKSQPWTTTDLRLNVDGATLDMYVNTLLRYSNKIAGGQQISDIRHESLTKRISDSLNLFCPKCKAVLDHNPEGCCAMRCSSCAAHFCWLCFNICPSSVACHTHVNECELNTSRSLFAPQSVKDRAHKMHRIERIRSVLIDTHDRAKYPHTEWTQSKEAMDALRELAPLLSQSQISGAEVLSVKHGNDVVHMQNFLRLFWTTSRHNLEQFMTTPQVGETAELFRRFCLKFDSAVLLLVSGRRNERTKAYFRLLAGLVLLLSWLLVSSSSSSSTRSFAAPRTKHNPSAVFAPLPICPTGVTTAVSAAHDSSSRARFAYHYVIQTKSQLQSPPDLVYHSMVADSDAVTDNMIVPRMCRDVSGGEVHVYHEVVVGNNGELKNKDEKIRKDKKTHSFQSQSVVPTVSEQQMSVTGGGGKDGKDSSWLDVVDKFVVVCGLVALSLLITTPPQRNKTELQEYSVLCLLGASFYVVIRTAGIVLWYVCNNMVSIILYCSIASGAVILFAAVAH